MNDNQSFYTVSILKFSPNKSSSTFDLLRSTIYSRMVGSCGPYFYISGYDLKQKEYVRGVRLKPLEALKAFEMKKELTPIKKGPAFRKAVKTGTLLRKYLGIYKSMKLRRSRKISEEERYSRLYDLLDSHSKKLWTKDHFVQLKLQEQSFVRQAKANSVEFDIKAWRQRERAYAEIKLAGKTVPNE